MTRQETRPSSWPEKLTPENVANWLWTNMTSPWNAQEILRAMVADAALAEPASGGEEI